MKNSCPLFLTLFFASQMLAQNALPTITNVEVDLSTANLLALTYDLADAEGEACHVTFRAAERGGLTFDFSTANATGDVGPGIAPGAGKTISWDYSALGISGEDFRLMLVADDGQTVDIQQIVNQVDSAELNSSMSFLEGIRHRTAGLSHLEETQDFIRFKFSEGKLENTQQEWAFGSYTGQNIIGRKIGTSEEATVYILDGHYDSVSNSPGADDNASAVAGMVEALRVLAPYSFKKSIRFIGFDLEEAGLVGSLRYTSEGIPAGETTAGVLNLEMIGYYSEAPNSQEVPMGFGLLYPDQQATLEANDFRGDFITVVGDGGSAGLISDFENAAASYVPGLSLISLEAPANWQIIFSDLGRSDHAPFWGIDVPALMLTDGAENRNMNYHTPNDKSDVLNFTFMRQVTQAAVATLAEQAEIQHATTWWADTDFFTPTAQVASCDFLLSPNPVKDVLRIEWPGCRPGDFTVELLDLNGRTVRQYERSANDGLDVQLVEVHGLEAGIYFLRLRSEKKEWVERVVVD